MLISGSIPPRIQAIAIVGSITLLLIIVNLIRREKLKEGYSIIWFTVTLLLVAFSTLSGLLDIFSRLIGISYAPATLFLILTGGLILLAIHFSVLLSKYDKRTKELAQHHAILKARLDTLNNDT